MSNYRQRKMKLKKAIETLRYYLYTGYAWPGGYELVMVDRNGLICQNCVKDLDLEDLKDLIRDIKRGKASVFAMDMVEEDIYCDCGYCWENPYED